MATAAKSIRPVSDRVTADDDVIRVLIVDDDPPFRRICREYLGEQGPGIYEVYEAGDADAAEVAFAETRFDCVLIDYRLPDTSGTGLMRRLCSVAETAPPMIILTGVGNEDIAMEAVHGGAADYIPKSRVSPQSLHRAVKSSVIRSRLERSVHERTKKLEEANRELHRKTDQIERFYHTISHEIKTPLTAAREFIALVADGTTGQISPQQRETLSLAIDSCDQLAAHVNELIESTRLDTGKMKIVKKSNKIETMIRRSVVSVQPSVQDKNIALKESVDENLPVLNVDGSRIVQVLSNLLANAVKFTEAGGQIRIGAARDSECDDRVRICVTDSGCGISEEHLPLIFDRLYQVNDHGDYLMGVGLGLGLSIAKEIVALHGGTLDVVSDVGQGSTFCVLLPLGDESDDKTPATATT